MPGATISVSAPPASGSAATSHAVIRACAVAPRSSRASWDRSSSRSDSRPSASARLPPVRRWTRIAVVMIRSSRAGTRAASDSRTSSSRPPSSSSATHRCSSARAGSGASRAAPRQRLPQRQPRAERRGQALRHARQLGLQPVEVTPVGRSEVRHRGTDRGPGGRDCCDGGPHDGERPEPRHGGACSRRRDRGPRPTGAPARVRRVASRRPARLRATRPGGRPARPPSPSAAGTIRFAPSTRRTSEAPARSSGAALTAAPASSAARPPTAPKPASRRPRRRRGCACRAT